MMKHNYPGYISLPCRVVLIVCVVLSAVFLIRVSAIGSRNTSETPPMSNVSAMSKVESGADPTYTFTESTIAKEDFALSTARIIKFSFSEVLYLANSYGNYTPILNEDGTPMTLTQFEEAMSDERN